MQWQLLRGILLCSGGHYKVLFGKWQHDCNTSPPPDSQLTTPSLQEEVGINSSLLLTNTYPPPHPPWKTQWRTPLWTHLYFPFTNQILQKKCSASLAEKRLKYTGLWLSYHKAKEVEKDKDWWNQRDSPVSLQCESDSASGLWPGKARSRYWSGSEAPPAPFGQKEPGKKRGGVEKG